MVVYPTIPPFLAPSPALQRSVRLTKKICVTSQFFGIERLALNHSLGILPYVYDSIIHRWSSRGSNSSRRRYVHQDTGHGDTGRGEATGRLLVLRAEMATDAIYSAPPTRVRETATSTPTTTNRKPVTLFWAASGPRVPTSCPELTKRCRLQAPETGKLQSTPLLWQRRPLRPDRRRQCAPR